MNEKEENNEIRKHEELARYFWHAQIKVHIMTNSGVFYNGLIKFVGSDFFIIDDDKNKSVAVFFIELRKKIEEFTEET